MSQDRDGAIGTPTGTESADILLGASRRVMGPAGIRGLRRRLLMRTGMILVVAGLVGCDTVSETYDDVVNWLDGEDEATPRPASTGGGFQPASSVPPAPDETAEDRRQRLRRELAGDNPQGYSGEPLTAQSTEQPVPALAPLPSSGPASYSAPAGDVGVYAPPANSVSGSTTAAAPEPAGLQPLFGSGASTQPAPQQTASYLAPGTDQAFPPPATAAPVPTFPDASGAGYSVQPLFGNNNQPAPAPTNFPQTPIPGQLPQPPAGMGDPAGMGTPGGVAAAPNFGTGAPASDAGLQNTTDPYAAYYGQTQPNLVPREPSPTNAIAPQFDRTSIPQTLSAAGVPPALPVQASPTTAFGSPIMNRRSPAPAAVGGQFGVRPGHGAPLMQTVAATPEPIQSGALLQGRLVKVGTIYFGNGSAGLSRDDMAVLRQIAQLHRQRGGSIQVVGHASQRTQQLSVMRHRLVNFRVSLARGERVKRALQRLGVNPAAIEVAADSDAQPVYREDMPSGEAGNRRVEVFFVY